MKYYFKIVYPLVVIALAVGAILGTAYQLLKPKLEQVALKEEKDALARAVPEAVSIESNRVKDGTNDYVFYVCKDRGGVVIGHIFKTSRNGYGGPVVCLVGITNHRVDTVVVVSMDKETAGFGQKIGDPDWLAQFRGFSLAKLPVRRSEFKDKGVDAVTSATYSTMAVTGGLIEAFEKYYRLAEWPGLYATNIVTNRSSREITTNFVTNAYTNSVDAQSGASDSKTGATNER